MAEVCTSHLTFLFLRLCLEKALQVNSSIKCLNCVWFGQMKYFPPSLYTAICSDIEIIALAGREAERRIHQASPQVSPSSQDKFETYYTMLYLSHQATTLAPGLVPLYPSMLRAIEPQQRAGCWSSEPLAWGWVRQESLKDGMVMQVGLWLLLAGCVSSFTSILFLCVTQNTGREAHLLSGLLCHQ